MTLYSDKNMFNQPNVVSSTKSNCFQINRTNQTNAVLFLLYVHVDYGLEGAGFFIDRTECIIKGRYSNSITKLY